MEIENKKAAYNRKLKEEAAKKREEMEEINRRILQEDMNTSERCEDTYNASDAKNDASDFEK